MSDSPTKVCVPLLAIPALLSAVLLVVGCDASSTRKDRSNDSEKVSSGRDNVTFYVPGMNDRLKIY